MRALLLVFVVGCGGVMEPGDPIAIANDASPDVAAVADASPDGTDAAHGTSCYVEQGGTETIYPCDGWTWGDAGASCSDQPCPMGATCVVFSVTPEQFGLCR